jgi:hypothetical protein
MLLFREKTVRPRNIQDHNDLLEQGTSLYKTTSNLLTNNIQRNDSNNEDEEEDQEMFEKGHIRQRSGYLSPTLTNAPLFANQQARDEQGTRQRKLAAHVDQVPNGASGLGLGLGSDDDPSDKGRKQVIWHKTKKQSVRPVQSEGLTGKDRNAFILLVMLCKFASIVPS